MPRVPPVRSGISDETKAEIARLARTGAPFHEIAKLTGVSISSVAKYSPLRLKAK